MAAASYVTLQSPDGKDYSIIIETIEAKEPLKMTFRCPTGLAASTCCTSGGRTRSPGSSSNPTSRPMPRRSSVDVEPGSIYSLTTTTGQHKGISQPPPSAPFPSPYEDNFDSYAQGTTPRYFSDQGGVVRDRLRSGFPAATPARRANRATVSVRSSTAAAFPGCRRPSRTR